MSFKISNNTHVRAGDLNFYDKVQSKFAGYNSENFKNLKTRVVPTASVRFGSFIGENTVLMPSFVNIGAYVGNGTMVDTWATVGSCAQIGENVHLSGGVGIGGVLEPLQATPTIIEDNCFIGARSEVVEGVVVKKTRSYPWEFLSENQQKFSTGKQGIYFTALSQRVASWSQAPCLEKAAYTSIAQ